MTAPVRAIVDASTIAKWVLADEDQRESALALIDDWQRYRRISLAAPAFAWYELTAMLVGAERPRHRSTPPSRT